MKFVDLGFENKEARQSCLDSFSVIESSGKYLLGEFLTLFENSFAQDQSVRGAACVKNATDALYMTFKMLDCDKRTVIVPCFGAYPTIVAALQAGSKSIIAAPIDRRMTLNLNDIEVPKDSIIVPVHIFGNQAEMTHIEKIAKNTNSIIIEDCAQSTGLIKSKESFAAVHSFYPTKPLGTRGDGGAIISDNLEFIEKCKKVRFYGLDEGSILSWGFNSRMDEWQAAFLLQKITYYRKNNEQRKKNARLILRDIDPGIDYTDECVYHQLVLRFKERNKIQDFLYREEIPSMIHYPKMLSDMPWLSGKADFSKMRQISEEVLSIPVGPHLENKDIDKISSFIQTHKSEILNEF